MKKKKSTKVKRLAPGIRKFIRQEKARLRQEVSNKKERKDRIKKIYQSFLRQF
ncbi:hypothetical protein K9K85_00325 [Patescibacteria group bacterium]|nr:hypothetical protein [Patescibacteria group bacterium]